VACRNKQGEQWHLELPCSPAARAVACSVAARLLHLFRLSFCMTPLAIKAQKMPRSPLRRGRQTKQAKARQARRLGSWSVLPDDVGFSREVRYSAALMHYLNSRIQSCYCAPIIWVFSPKNRETEVAARSDAALIKGLIRGIPERSALLALVWRRHSPNGT